MANQIVVQGNAYHDMYEYMDGKTVIVTDPPFNIGYHYRTYKDNKKDEDYWCGLAHLLVRYPCAVIMYPESLFVLAQWMDRIPTEIASWVYNANTARQHRDCAYFGVKPDFSLYKQPYKNMNDKRVKKLYEKTGGAKSYDWFECQQVKNVNKDDGGTGIIHPCQMPVDVMKYFVGIIPANFRIIDPFAGSGTTGVACKLLDREFVGIELDPEYVKLANARIEKTEVPASPQKDVDNKS